MIKNKKSIAILTVLLLSTGHLYSQDIYRNINDSSQFNAFHSLNGLSGASEYGTGQAFIDINNNGFQDIVVSNQTGPNRLFINQGDETFIQLAKFQNIALADSLCKGVSIADFNNDGWDDIYFSCMGPDYLFKNINGNELVNVASEVGINNPYNTQLAAWADINNDGWLDIYVINHDVGYHESVTEVHGAPIVDAFYLSNGDGTFTDIITDFDSMQTIKPNLAVTFFDYDNDGDQDLYVVSDRVKGNVLWKNDGPATNNCGSHWCFSDVSESSNSDKAVFGMGVATGDIDNDGDYDLYFSSIGEQVLLLNQTSQGNNVFVDASPGSALNIPTLSWGTMFLDYNNDSWLDAYISVHGFAEGLTDTLFENNQDGTFTNLNATTGATNHFDSEGVANGDINNDGKLDIVLANRGVNYQLFKNEAINSNNWIRLKLVGGDNINKNAIGSKVIVNTDNGVSQIRTLSSGSSRGAGNELILHFGLGSANITSMQIIWSDGSVQNITPPTVNQLTTIDYTGFNLIFANGFE